MKPNTSALAAFFVSFALFAGLAIAKPRLTQPPKQVADEGTALPFEPTLNFVGQAIACVDVPGSLRTDCYIDAGTSSSGGEYYWFDAGAFGATQANATQVSMGNPGNISVDGGYYDAVSRASATIFNEDGGVSLVIGSSTFEGSAVATTGYTMSLINYVGAPSIGFWRRKGVGTAFGPTASIEASTAYGGSSGGLNFTTESGTDGFVFRVGTGRNQPLMSLTAPSFTTTMVINGTVAGNDALRFDVAGAQLHFSGGANDYMYSNGTGILTPTYLRSAYAFASGSGLEAARVRASGGVLDGYTAAAAASSGVGATSWDTTSARMMVEKTTTGFAPIAQPHTFHDGQSFSTRIVEGTSVSTGNRGPELAQVTRTGTNLADTVQMYWDYGASGSANGGYSSTPDRTIWLVTTTAADTSRVYGMTASSGATSTFLPLVSSSASPEWCQNISTAGTIGTMRVWAGLMSTIQTANSSTLTGTGVAFRYDTTVDGLLYICTKDSTTQACTSTGITVAAATSYDLCIKLDSSRNVYATVNGVTLVKRTTNLPTTLTALGPFVSLETAGTASARSLSIGIFQVTSR